MTEGRVEAAQRTPGGLTYVAVSGPQHEADRLMRLGKIAVQLRPYRPEPTLWQDRLRAFRLGVLALLGAWVMAGGPGLYHSDAAPATPPPSDHEEQRA